MSKEKFLKITYHSDKQNKLSIYLRLQDALNEETAHRLIVGRISPKGEIRKYWIDRDGDEIDVSNQYDYGAFLAQCPEDPHLHVAAKQSTSSAQPANDGYGPQADDPAAFVIHERVECDACGLAPIVGFRYKCIQCPNFDLCQRCESQHKHPEHMMVRMPNENAPTIESWWLNGPPYCGARSGRHSKRERRGEFCPFAAAAAASASANAQADTDENTAREAGFTGCGYASGSKHRRLRRRGVLSHVYQAMQDLAEGGAGIYRETPEEDGAPKNGTTASQTNPESDAQNTARIVADVATRAAEYATKVAQQAADLTATVVAQTEAMNAEATAPPKEEEGAAAAAPPQEENNKNTNAEAKTSSQNEKPDEPKQNSNENTSIPVTPSLEDLAQFIDPKIMSAGMQILTNLGEMFAKIMDPAEGNYSQRSNANEKNAADNAGAAANQPRKNSTSSMSSVDVTVETSVSVTPESNDNDSKKKRKVEKEQRKAERENKRLEKEKKKIEKEQREQAIKNLRKTMQADLPIEIISASVIPRSHEFPNNDTVEIKSVEIFPRREESPDTSRAQSEEGDWQVIDTQQADSVNSSSDEDSLKENSAEKIERNSPQITIDFKQLSDDLKKHVDNEKKREEQMKQAKTVTAAASSTSVSTSGNGQTFASVSTTTNGKTTSVSTTTNGYTTTNVSTSTNGKPSDNGAKSKVPVIYHSNERINNAVHAMMAMGFSNEGAWLTQLLESVNGNISEALDLMSPAQQNQRN